MSSNKEHIDLKELESYFSGKMTSAEKNAFEQKALDDPFLQDAIEGFENNPGSFDDFVNKHGGTNKSWRNSIAARSLTIIGLAALIYVGALVLDNPEEKTNEEIADVPTTDSIITKEVELIPVELETLIVAAKEDQISAQQFVNESNSNEIYKSYNYDTVPANTEITDDIVEPVYPSIDDKIYPEEHELNIVERVPATYLFDMFVVDYTRIKRKKTSITYTRFELSGTPADLENDETQINENELIEKEVDIPYFEYLRTSMEYFKDGYFKKALKRYLTILEQYEGDANALFYGGLCYFNMKKYEKSLEFFDQLLDLPLQAFKEEAKWYKVKCLIKLGLSVEAKNILDEIIIEGGFYLEDAMKLRKELK